MKKIILLVLLLSSTAFGFGDISMLPPPSQPTVGQPALTAEAIIECQSEENYLVFYRCPFGFCYEVQYQGEYGNGFASNSVGSEVGIVSGPARASFIRTTQGHELLVDRRFEDVTYIIGQKIFDKLTCEDL